MQKIQALKRGYYYHIFNRGINSCNIFNSSSNYEYFLELYEKYISPIADTYGWVLMPNHFHFLVRIKEENDISIPTIFEFIQFLCTSLQQTKQPPRQSFRTAF
ncbi:MAG: transposase [Bacteroidales bacterium]|nr:transposase [Bacteroidales bacterium]